ncbi:MAG: hypothetical protein JO066_09005 [Verrucomicrobia bacterium]|nr:hypothetical protein [Verrucomicrobiota bacterium]
MSGSSEELLGNHTSGVSVSGIVALQGGVRSDQQSGKEITLLSVPVSIVAANMVTTRQIEQK